MPAITRLANSWATGEAPNGIAPPQGGRVVADIALKAASAVEEAAQETEAAAKPRWRLPIERKSLRPARRAAHQAAEAAQLLSAAAEGDKVRANHAVEDADTAETTARDRFHDAENQGFPKDYTTPLSSGNSGVCRQRPPAAQRGRNQVPGSRDVGATDRGVLLTWVAM